MDVKNINPFILAVHEVFECFLECSVESGKIQIYSGDNGSLDIIGIIGLSGSAQGSVILRFPVQTALSIVGKLLSKRLRSVDSAVVDGVGELTNIVAGKAKAKFDGHSLSISLPTVVRGAIFKNDESSHPKLLEIPFKSDLGTFSLAVMFKEVAVKDKEHIHESSCC